MVRFDMLPRLAPDFHCDTVGEALAEVSRRKASPIAEDAATRFDRSPYGGYRVFTVSLSFAMDMLEDPVVSRRFVSTEPPGPSLYDQDPI